LIRQTTHRDFEVEIIGHLLNTGREDILKQIIHDYTGAPVDPNSGAIIYATFQLGKLEKNKTKYSAFINPATVISGNLRLNSITNTEIELKKLWYLTWFISNKDIVLGGIIGDNLTATDIPQIYKDIINDAILLT